MKTTGPAAPTRAKVISPRLNGLEFEVVAARIPKEQVQWLQKEAARGFRGRGDQVALLINEAYEQRSEP